MEALTGRHILVGANRLWRSQSSKKPTNGEGVEEGVKVLFDVRI
jgi:hypothetical protein